MTDELGPNGPDETPTASDREIAAVEALLARADGDRTLWADPPVDGEARLLAAIGTDTAPTKVGPRDAAEAADVAADEVGDRRRSVRPRFTTTSWLAMAAALVVVVTGIALVVRSGDDSTAFALAGTDRAPEASAEVEVGVDDLAFERTWIQFEVRAAIDALPADEREVIRRSHLLGETHRQIADAMGVPVGTVKSRSGRAFKRLAAALDHLDANQVESPDVVKDEEGS